MAKANILVVEDETIVAMDIQNLLRSLGYAVPAVVSSGEESIEKARKTQPDLVLMDIRLKGAMDGVEAAKEIWDQFNIPVVYLTAYADEATLQRAMITEPFGYLLKPFEERELHTAVEMALFKHGMEIKLRESERWLATTLKSIGDAVIATDAQGCITFMNPIAEGLTGWKQKEALEKNLEDVFQIINEHTRMPTESPVARVLQEGVVIGLGNHSLLVSSDGTETPIDDNAAPIINDKGEITGVVLIFQDVTERKQAEEAIQARNRELALLNEIIAASAAGLEPELVLEAACRELALALDVPHVAAALLNHEKTKVTVVAEYLAGGQPPLLDSATPAADDHWFQYLLTHKAPLAASDGGSLLVFPLMIEGEVLGSLGLEAVETRRFSTDEVNLARSVADQVAGALARAQFNAERQRLGAAIEQTAESVIITDTKGTIVYVNPAFERVTGYDRAEVIGQNPSLLNSREQDAAFYQELWATINTGKVWHGRFVNKRKDASLYTADTTITPVRNGNRAIVNYVAVSRDVTRELQLEEQYRQAQKMEAVGLLAGGIAHDFNNLLTAINGFAELMQFQLTPDDSLYELAGKILSSGRRAASLTRQLLAFSRKQLIEPKVLNINSVVAEIEKMLKRIIGEHIQMETILAPDLWSVKVDPAQFEQVVVNLAVNARDAMPEGGKLTIETANVTVDEEFVAEHLELEPGEFVSLSVSDTGMGMSDEVKAHLFEPFFTTKRLGEGTGLGLATAHGIVKQSGGHFWVESQEGRGTIFTIYLPRTQDAKFALAYSKVEADVPSGSETVLLVEDDPQVRELTHRVLQEQGYTVLEASNGEEALQLVTGHSGPIDLLLTDVVMPGISGKALADQLLKTQPDLRTIFMSGYTDEAIAHHGVLDPDVAFLQKPFSPTALARKVRYVLDSLGGN